MPGVFVASDPFVTTAEAQSEALGFDAARLFVAHPIQDRTDEEMLSIADAAAEEILRKLVAAGRGAT